MLFRKLLHAALPLGVLSAALLAAPAAQASPAVASDDVHAYAWYVIGGPYEYSEYGYNSCIVAGVIKMQEGGYRAVQCLLDGETGDRYWLWGDTI